MRLFGTTSPAVPVPDVWSLQHPVLHTLLWCAVLLLVIVPPAIRLYRRAARADRSAARPHPRAR